MGGGDTNSPPPLPIFEYVPRDRSAMAQPFNGKHFFSKPPDPDPSLVPPPTLRGV